MPTVSFEKYRINYNNECILFFNFCQNNSTEKKYIELFCVTGILLLCCVLFLFSVDFVRHYLWPLLTPEVWF